MDNLTLEVLLHELKPNILRKTIQKIKQTSDRTLIFALRSRKTEFLTICLDPSHPTLFLTQKEDKVSESASTDWLFALRKYLVGGWIVDVNKKLADRILLFGFENDRVSPRLEKLTLVLELIPPKPNALLLNDRQELLASFQTQKGFSGAEQTFYKPPEARSAFSIDQIAKEKFQELVRSCRLATESETATISGDGAQPAGLDANKEAPLWSKLSGISPYFVREIAYEAANDPEVLWERLQAILKRVRYGPYSPHIYFLKPSVASFRWAQGMRPSNKATGMAEKILIVPFPFDSMKGIEHREFLSLNAACIEAYQVFCAGTRFLKRQQSQMSLVSTRLRKRVRLLEGLQADLRKNDRFQIYKKYADLLYAQPAKSAPGKSMLRVIDLFDPNQAEIKVPLDPRLSAIQNANRYSKLYQKANRAFPSIKARIQCVEAEIELLDFQQKMLAKAETVVDLEKAMEQQEKKVGQRRVGRDPLPVEGRNTAKDTLAHPQSLLRKAAKSFISSEGLSILVGKSSKENDILTLRIAKSEDFWFHVAGYGGSHVVLKNPEKLTMPPRQSLLEAAQLAAYFSQARNAPKVEVHYTQKRFVSKPKGTKPGLVRLKEYKSISVRPQLLGSGEASEP